MKNYVAYGYKTLEGAIKAITGQEFEKFKNESLFLED